MKGHHKKEDRHDTGVRAKNDADPVCGMEVDESKAEHRVVHLGKTFYFCALGCKKSFEENPEKYIGKTRKAGCCG